MRIVIGIVVSFYYLFGLLFVWYSTFDNFEINFQFLCYTFFTVVVSIGVGVLIAESPLWDE